MRVSFKDSEFIKSKIDILYMKNPKEKMTHRSLKTTVPSKLREKERMYEWCVKIFWIRSAESNMYHK